jgi:hypothetical protein
MRVFSSWRSFEDARVVLSDRLLPQDASYLGDVYRFAADQHAGQTRPAGEPYLVHPLQVLEVLVTHAKVTDQAVLAAGLLHDTVEDTGCTIDELHDRFGQRTAALVEAVTLHPAGPGQDKTPTRRDQLAKLAAAPVEVRRLKLADRYTNVQQLHTHPRPVKQRAYFEEACRYIVPVAAADPVFADLYDSWQQAYSYLARDAVDTPEAADQLATVVHHSQADKAGHPYIEHPRAVATLLAGADATVTMAALLHDTVEDGACTLDQLTGLRVPPAVVETVDALTRRPDEPHGRYLTRLRRNPVAVTVKQADITHNSQPTRLDALDRAVAARLWRKYAAARWIIDHANEPCYLIEHHDRTPARAQTHVPYRVLWRICEHHEWEHFSVIDWAWRRAPDYGQLPLPPLERLSPTSQYHAHGLATAPQLWVAWYATSWSPSDETPVGVVRRRISPEIVLDETFTTHLTWEPTGIIHEAETAPSSSQLHLRPIDHTTAERLLRDLCDVQDAISLGDGNNRTTGHDREPRRAPGNDHADPRNDHQWAMATRNWHRRPAYPCGRQPTTGQVRGWSPFHVTNRIHGLRTRLPTLHQVRAG